MKKAFDVWRSTSYQLTEKVCCITARYTGENRLRFAFDLHIDMDEDTCKADSV